MKPTCKLHQAVSIGGPRKVAEVSPFPTDEWSMKAALTAFCARCHDHHPPASLPRRYPPSRQTYGVWRLEQSWRPPVADATIVTRLPSSQADPQRPVCSAGVPPTQYPPPTHADKGLPTASVFSGGTPRPQPYFSIHPTLQLCGDGGLTTPDATLTLGRCKVAGRSTPAAPSGLSTGRHSPCASFPPRVRHNHSLHM